MNNQTNAQTLGYRGKHFVVPKLSSSGFEIVADPTLNTAPIPSAMDSPIIADLNSIWDFQKFKTPRIPVSLGFLTNAERFEFSKSGAPRTLDMPIKFPGSNFRIPAELAQFRGTIERVAHFEAAINPDCFDEYYCYMTVDQGLVRPNTLQREAPCHVDGFQGARWPNKVRINHSYVVGDRLPTTYYPQAFDFDALDEALHNFFWEMNRQVANNHSAGAFRPGDCEIGLIDAYTVHRGSEAQTETFRTWIRLSFEARQFDRLGNAHNPLFQYNWPMVPRDIEGLGLVAFDETCDPSLLVFPWQNTDGSAHDDPK